LTRFLALLAASTSALGAAAAPAQEPPPPSPVPEPPPAFELTRSTVNPQKAFFAERELPTLTYEFAAQGAVDVRIELVRAGKVVDSWTEPARAPFTGHQLTWNPVGGEVPERGRTHEGQDMWAACGSELVAARGGTVQNKGYSGALYGHFVTIDGAGTRRDYFYAHLSGPSPLGDGERVFTGQRIGAVGKTGNAIGEGCQLHFELWPHGFRDGRPADPLRDLRRWDGWS
jgi:murein DD-endopeptidase MepM/ murein hydrolase activator NlpD